MGRPFFPSELDDPDLDWLVSNFLYERPDYVPVETGSLPLVLLPYTEEPMIELETETETSEDHFMIGEVPEEIEAELEDE